MATALTAPTDGAGALSSRERAVAAGLAVMGVLLWWACRYHASALPVWMPWDFSPLWYAAFVGTGWAYVRGWWIAPQPLWRTGLFALGMAVVWAVLQTRFEYSAQHMFFLNRIQHVVMHHLGPFLVAVAWPWETILRGMPARVRGWFSHRWADAALGFFRQPEIACGLFVGLIALWLTPAVHFVAMINPALYQLMNWSMVVDGALFWSVVLDPRDARQAGNGYAARAVMGIGVMFPQIAIGALIAFQSHDIYAFYAWCGRLYPGIDAIADQRIGGCIVWIPPAMMSALSLLLVLNAMRIEEERTGAKPSGGVASASWTGR